MTEGTGTRGGASAAEALGLTEASPSPRPGGCTGLVSPYGGRLVDLRPSRDERAELAERAHRLPSIRLSRRSLSDLTLLATGAFSPLDRFLGQEGYRRVLEEMRLASGHLFPVPVTLPVDPDRSAGTLDRTSPGRISLDREVALRGSGGHLLAVLRIEEIFEREPEREARAVCSTTDPRHPLVAEMRGWGKLYVSGPLKLVRLPTGEDVGRDFRPLRLTPAQTREALERYGRGDVVAFQPRGPLRRAEGELALRAVEELDGTLLLHPVAGAAPAGSGSRLGDADLSARVRSCQALMGDLYPRDRALLALLPLAPRWAGPREALWHALIRRNFGANHLILGRDPAGPGTDSRGRPFDPSGAAQELVERHAEELGVAMVPLREVAQVPLEGRPGPDRSAPGRPAVERATPDRREEVA